MTGLRCRLDEETQYRGLDPLLLVASDRRLERARWHPTNDNLFATVAASDRAIYIYDAQYTQVCLRHMYAQYIVHTGMPQRFEEGVNIMQ